MSNDLTPRPRSLIQSAGTCVLPEKVGSHSYSGAPPKHTFTPPTGMPFPICDICNRQVRSFNFTHQTDGTIIFRAYCHGDMDTVRIPNLPTDGAFLERGRAFVRRRLPTIALPLSRSWYQRTAHLPIKVRR